RGARNELRDPHVVLEIVERPVRVCGEPVGRPHLSVTRPVLEPLFVVRAATCDPARLRKVLGVAPDGGEPARRAVHEFAEVTLPASVVVAEKEQTPSPSSTVGIELDPAGKVNAGDSSEGPLVPIDEADAPADDPEHVLEEPVAEPTRFH